MPYLVYTLVLGTALRSRTNLVDEDDIPYILQEPGNFPEVWNGVDNLLWFELPSERLQLFFDGLQLPVRKSAPSTIGVWSRTVSLHPGDSPQPRHLGVNQSVLLTQQRARGAL